MWWSICLGLGAMFATDTGATPARPALAVVLHANNGSLPPPHRRSTELRIGADGRARYTFLVGYDRDDPQRRFEESFTVLAADHAALAELVEREAVFATEWQALQRPPVGGPVRQLSFERDGQPILLPTFPVASQEASVRVLVEAVLALLPKDTLERRRAWESAHDPE